MKLNSLSQKMIGDNSYEMAILDYTRAIALDSTFAYAWYNRAAAKIALNEFYSAILDLRKAISCDSTFGEAYFNKSLLHILLHENENACPDLSKAGELGVLEAYAVIKRYCDK